MKINPKKQRIHRRLRSFVVNGITNIIIAQTSGTCKECMIRPRKHGSSRCEKCSQEYKLKN